MSWLVVLFLAAFNRPSWSRPCRRCSRRNKSMSATRSWTWCFCSSWFFALVVAAVTFYFVASPRWCFRFARITFGGNHHAARGIDICDEWIFRKMFFVQGRNITALVLRRISYSTQIVGLVGVAYLHQLNLQRAIIIIALSNSISSTYGILKVKRIEFHFTAFGAHLKKTWNYSGWLIGTSLLQWFSEIFSLLQRRNSRSGSSGELFGWRRILSGAEYTFLAMENFIPSNAAKIYHDKGLKNLYAYLRQVMMVADDHLHAHSFALLFFQANYWCIVRTWFRSIWKCFVWICIALLVCLYRFVAAIFSFAPWRKTATSSFPYALSAGFSLLLAAPMVSTFGMRRVFAGLILTGDCSALVSLFFKIRTCCSMEIIHLILGKAILNGWMVWIKWSSSAGYINRCLDIMYRYGELHLTGRRISGSQLWHTFVSVVEK